METKVTSPAVKGALLALVLIVFSLGSYFSGQSQNKSLSYIAFLLFAVAIILSCTYYSKQKNGNITFGNAFADGFKTTAAATAISLVYTYLALKFIMPDMIDMAIEDARKTMDSNKNMTPEQVDKSMSMMQNYFVPFAIGGALFMYLLTGVIASLIGAAIAKKNPAPTPFEQ
ncbi:MAG: DUF4199 domain-containing protein [Deinococcales bacterium]|nr:DUF4199 domain-containing protein [Chitinophagaceae bacterium]